jgi:RIO-like serine/threonine protein kinase
MSHHKITTSEQSVLERLVFPEPFATIMEETGLKYGELRDDLINLLNFGFVEAYEVKGERITSTGFYDADNLQDFTFRATSKGLSAI